MKTREELVRVIEALKEELTYVKEEVSSYTSNVKGFKKDVKESIDMIRYLEKRLQELEEEPYIKDGDAFYFMNNMGDAIPRRDFKRSGNNLKKLEFGNISKSLGYIEETARMVKMTQRLRLFLEKEGYEDWEPDWEDAGQDKWYFYKNHDDNKYHFHYVNVASVVGIVYFPTKELTKKAVKEVAEPLEREWAEK